MWWRWEVWMAERGEAGQISILLGAFIAYRVLLAFAQNAENELMTSVVLTVWLSIVAYTWFSPMIFRWLIEKELGDVQLKRDF